MATNQEMEKEVSQWESALAGISETRQAAHGHIAGLERKRQELALAARVNKNPAAQKTLHEIESQLVTARHEDGHDEAAGAEIEKKLQALRPALALAKRLLEREQLRKFIASRADKDRPARIVKLVHDLVAELGEWRADKNEVAAALTQFDPQFASVANALVSSYLEPARVEYGTGEHLARFELHAPKIFDEALAAIEAESQPGEPVPSDRRAYRVKDHAHFHFHAREFHGGETLYLKPEHAAEYIEAGLLEERAVAAEEVAAS